MNTKKPPTKTKMPNSTCSATDLRIKDCPKAGTGVHSWIYHVVCRMVDADIDDVDIVKYCEENCSRSLQPNEVQNAIVSRRGQLQRGDQQNLSWHKPNQDHIAEIIENPTSVNSLFKLSPMPLEEYDSEKIIDYLFPGNPLLCCGASTYTFATRPREEWRGKLGNLQLIVPSPMSEIYGTTQAGKRSMHTLDNTGPRQYLVVEFDEGTHDNHAALLWHLNTGLTPLICAVSSGNKSLHGWFHVSNWEEDRLRAFFNRATQIGADPATWTKSQFVRMPDGTRSNGSKQTTIYLSDKLL